MRILLRGRMRNRVFRFHTLLFRGVVYLSSLATDFASVRHILIAFSRTLTVPSVCFLRTPSLFDLVVTEWGSFAFPGRAAAWSISENAPLKCHNRSVFRYLAITYSPQSPIRQAGIVFQSVSISLSLRALSYSGNPPKIPTCV